MADLPKPLAEDELAAMRERLALIPPRPWASQVVGKHGYPQRVVANDDGLVLVAEIYEGPDFPPAIADFIAHAPTDIDLLLATIESDRQRIQRLRAVVLAVKDEVPGTSKPRPSYYIPPPLHVALDALPPGDL